MLNVPNFKGTSIDDFFVFRCGLRRKGLQKLTSQGSRAYMYGMDQLIFRRLTYCIALFHRVNISNGSGSRTNSSCLAVPGPVLRRTQIV